MAHDAKLRTAAQAPGWRPVQAEVVSRAAFVRGGVPARQDQQYHLLPVWQASLERPAASVKDVPVGDDTPEEGPPPTP